MNIFRELVTSNNQSHIYSHGSDHSYKSLIQDADKFSSFTINRPLVFIIAKNSYDCLAGYVGLLRANAVVVLISDTIHESLWNDLVKNYFLAYSLPRLCPNVERIHESLFRCEIVKKNYFF